VSSGVVSSGVESETGLLPEETRSGVSFWELLHHIVECDPPPLPAGSFSQPFQNFLRKCLCRSGRDRPSAAALLEDEWLRNYSDHHLSIAEWLQQESPR